MSGFRAQQGTGGFAMFDFTPIGLAVALGGILFIVLLGWRLVPAREKASTEGFETGAYVTEVRVCPTARPRACSCARSSARLDEADAQVIGLVRNEVRMTAPQSSRKVLAGDILVIEADIEALPEVLSTLGLKLEEAGSSSAERRDRDRRTREQPQPRQSLRRPPPTPQQARRTSKSETNKGQAANGTRTTKPKARDDSDAARLERDHPDGAGRPPRGRPHRPLGQGSALRTRYGLNLLAVSRNGQRSEVAA